MNDWKPKYMVHFEDGTFIYCSTLRFCQRILEKAYSAGYKVRVTGSDFYGTEKEDHTKEVTQCQENAQQP